MVRAKKRQWAVRARLWSQSTRRNLRTKRDQGIPIDPDKQLFGRHKHKRSGEKRERGLSGYNALEIYGRESGVGREDRKGTRGPEKNSASRSLLSSGKKERDSKFGR